MLTDKQTGSEPPRLGECIYMSVLMENPHNPGFIKAVVVNESLLEPTSRTGCCYLHRI